MRKNLARHYFLILLLLVVRNSINAQDKLPGDLKYSTSASVLNFDYDDQLRSIAAEAWVIGLGEATHGTAEFEQVKIEIIKLLVCRYHYRHIIMETGFPQGFAFNDYILGKEVNIKRLMMVYMPWPYSTKGILDLVNWLRQYNSDKPDPEKVRFYGMDIHGYHALQAMRMELNKAGAVSGVKDSSIVAALEKMSGSEKEKKKYLEDLLTDYRNKKYESQVDSMIMMNVLESQLNINTGHGGKRYKHREELLFRYADYIINTLSRDEKVIIWAHNEHVSKKYSGRRSLGEMLEDKYGSGYKVVGFEANKGSFRARKLNATGDSSGVNTYALVSYPDMLGSIVQPFNKGILGIPVSVNKKHALVGKPQYVHSVGAAYVFSSGPVKKLCTDKLTVARSYDYLFVVDVMHPTEAAY